MRNGLQKQAQEIAEGLLALFFGSPAATTAFYGLSFIDWLFFRRVFNLSLPAPDRAEIFGTSHS
jgi:hypothetical protein